jgi:surface carbohydrate biosynthesis protein
MILRLDLGGNLDKIPRTWAWVKVLGCLRKSIIKYTFAMLSFVSGEDRSENGKEFYTSNRARPTVYIPIELKNRELDSQVLLATRLARIGFRIYLGTHAAIFALLKSKQDKSGIYLDKGTQPYEKMKWIKEKCEYIAILDQELGPAVSQPEIAFSEWPSRIYPGTAELIDKYFCVGPKAFRAALEFFGTRRDVALLTGWPRADIWGSLGLKIYGTEISKIDESFSPYLLFVSDFHYVSQPKERKNGHISEIRMTDDFATQESLFKQFQETVEILKIWDRDPRVLPIVVRPHLTEDVRAWKSQLGRMRKTQIVRHGDIAPWILASEGVIHRGSTTSIQAKLSGKPVYFLESTSMISRDQIQVAVSDFVVDAHNIPNLEVQQACDAEPSVHTNDLLRQHIFLSQGLAVDNVVAELRKHPPLREIAISRRRLLISQISRRSLLRLLGLLRHEIFWALRITEIPSQLHNTPWGIRKSEIEKVAFLDLDAKLPTLRRMSVNCWEVS